jgi:hypothetical protein
VTTAKKGTRKAVTAAKFGAVGAAASLLAWDAFDAVKQIRANRRGPRGQALRNQIARQPPL